MSRSFFQLLSDGWIFSHELTTKQLLVEQLDQSIVQLNMRKVFKAINKILDGSLYLANWENAASRKQRGRDFLEEELQLAKVQ